MSLHDLHQGFSWVTIIANGLAGSWALAANWLTALRGRALWWFVGVAQITIFVQVVLGVLLTRRTGVELPRFHAFYGFVAIVAIGIIYSYRSQMKHQIYLLYGLGGLFVMGLAIRSMMLSHAIR